MNRVEELEKRLVDEDFDRAELNQIMDFCFKRLKQIGHTQRKNEKEIDRMFGLNPE